MQLLASGSLAVGVCMRLTSTSQEGYTVLAIDGALTLDDVPELQRHLGVALAQAHDSVVCDLTHLGTADPQAVTIFTRNAFLTDGPGPLIYLAGARGAVSEVLERMGLARFVGLADSVSDAALLARHRAPRLCAVQAFDQGPVAPRHARRFAGQVLLQWDLSAVADDVALAASELATNAVTHAQTALLVRLERTADRVFLSVKDQHDDPVLVWWDGQGGWRGGEPSEGGQGLRIVRALAAATGAYAHPAGGAVVWASFAVPGPRPGHPLLPGRAVRARMTVMTGRVGPDGRARWAVHLELVWRPEEPEVVSVALRPQPHHPALPVGEWRLPLPVLTDGLQHWVDLAGWQAWPDRGGEQLVLDMPAARVRTVRLPAWRIRGFLDAIGSTP